MLNRRCDVRSASGTNTCPATAARVRSSYPSSSNSEHKPSTFGRAQEGQDLTGLAGARCGTQIQSVRLCGPVPPASPHAAKQSFPTRILRRDVADMGFARAEWASWHLQLPSLRPPLSPPLGPPFLEPEQPANRPAMKTGMGRGREVRPFWHRVQSSQCEDTAEENPILRAAVLSPGFGARVSVDG